jgi:hypothetical protein
MTPDAMSGSRFVKNKFGHGYVIGPSKNSLGVTNVKSPIAKGARGPAMSYLRKGILGAVAVAATFGAAQFAAGEGITVGTRTAGLPDQGVNRMAKADRGPILGEPVAPTQTISIQVDRVPGTSVLVRIQRNHETQTSATPPSLQLRTGERKVTVACEPVVSVLTEIAKRLQPGRCVT